MDNLKLEQLAGQVQQEIDHKKAEDAALSNRMWQLRLVCRAGLVPKPVRKDWRGYLTSKRYCPNDGALLDRYSHGAPGIGYLASFSDYYSKCTRCDYEYIGSL